MKENITPIVLKKLSATKLYSGEPNWEWDRGWDNFDIGTGKKRKLNCQSNQPKRRPLLLDAVGGTSCKITFPSNEVNFTHSTPSSHIKVENEGTSE